MAWKALSTNLRELRVHLSTTGSGSEGVRKFIMQSYALIKNDNPDFPFLIREAEGTGAKLTARYDYGAEKAVDVEGADAARVEQSLKHLMNEGPKYNRGATPS